MASDTDINIALYLKETNLYMKTAVNGLLSHSHKKSWQDNTIIDQIETAMDIINGVYTLHCSNAGIKPEDVH